MEAEKGGWKRRGKEKDIAILHRGIGDQRVEEYGTTRRRKRRKPKMRKGIDHEEIESDGNTGTSSAGRSTV